MRFFPLYNVQLHRKSDAECISDVTEFRLSKPVVFRRYMLQLRSSKLRHCRQAGAWGQGGVGRCLKNRLDCLFGATNPDGVTGCQARQMFAKIIRQKNSLPWLREKRRAVSSARSGRMRGFFRDLVGQASA